MEPNDADPAVLDQPLQIEVQAVGRARTLWLRGELDPHTAPVLQAEVDRCLLDGVDDLTFDLDALRFIDSSGLRVLVAVHQSMLDRGGRLVLRSPGPTAARLFEITGLADHLAIEPAADADGSTGSAGAPA